MITCVPVSIIAYVTVVVSFLCSLIYVYGQIERLFRLCSFWKLFNFYLLGSCGLVTSDFNVKVYDTIGSSKVDEDSYSRYFDSLCSLVVNYS